MFGIKTEFIQAVGASGLSFEEIACISGMAEINLYKVAAGKIALNDAEKRRLATILDRPMEDLFPEDNGESNG